MELISLEGLRNDGRKPAELRKMSAKIRVFPDANGSSYFECGNSKVLVSVYGPRGNPSKAHRSKVTQEEAFVSCEVVLSEFSSTERKETTRNERAAGEIACAVEQTFENVIFTHLLPDCQVDIFIEVLEADGSLAAAAINATSLALVDAGIPMKDFVCACSASFVDGRPMVDLNHLEELLCGPVLVLGLMPQKKRQALLEMSARFHFENVDEVLRAAEDGCLRINSLMNDEVLKMLNYVAPRLPPE